MKQVIVDGPFVREVIENAPEPITIGIAVPDNIVVSVGQILEDDFSVRDVTDQDLLNRFGINCNIEEKRSFVLGGMILKNPIAEPEIFEVTSEQTTDTTTEAVE